MNQRNWIKRIEIAPSLDVLAELREVLENDEDLDEQELSIVESKLIEKENEIISTTPKRKKKEETDNNDRSEKPILFKSDLYDRDADDDKPSFELLMSEGMSINDFLKEIFYSEFIKLPESDLQVPICMAIGYLNSMVVPDTVSFPMVYVYSPEAGSGKSQLAYHWSDFYHPFYRLMFRDDTTGASLRNKMTSVTDLDQPVIAVIDNYHAARTKERLTVIGWASFMANNRLESKAQIVADTEGGIVSFNTHALKVFTSITPLGNTVEQSSELKSRCITIYANKERKGINQFRSSYNWNGLQDRYLEVWGDPDRCNREFKKGLIKDLLQMNPKSLPFHNREWQISIPLMASGVFAGVWKDLKTAISHMADYWDWESGKKSNKMSPLESVIVNYVTDLHIAKVRDHLENIEGTSRTQELFEDKIRLSEIYNHLKELHNGSGFSEVKKTNHNDVLISNIMYDLGFVSDMEKTRTNKVVGMYFYKQ